MSDANSHVAAMAWASIERLGPSEEEAKKAWRSALNSTDHEWVVQASRRLSELGDNTFYTRFAEQLQSDDANDRLAARQALGEMNLTTAQWLDLLRPARP